MKKVSFIKLCWFCEKQCYHFVSICPECVVNKRKKIKIKQNDENNKKTLDEKKVIL